jgi:hypothetical protein
MGRIGCTADAWMRMRSTSDAWSMEHGAWGSLGAWGWEHGAWSGCGCGCMADIGSMADLSAWEQHSMGMAEKRQKSELRQAESTPPTFAQGRFRIGPGRAKAGGNPQPLCI